MFLILNSFKRFLIILILLSSVGFANAQEFNRFKFGITVSPSANWLSIKSQGTGSGGSAVNMNYGLSTDFALKGSDRYYFSTGVTILSNGGKINYTAVEVENEVLFESHNESKITTRYVEIPIALKLRTHEIGYSVFAGKFGFGTGFRINGFEERTTSFYSTNSIYNEKTERRNIQEKIKPVRFAMIVGVEWERKITKDTYFTFGFTFNNGLSNIFNLNTYNLNESGNLDWDSVNGDGRASGPSLKGTSKTIAFQFGIYF